MYMCVHMCMSVHMRVCEGAHARVYTCVKVYMHVEKHIHILAHVCEGMHACV